MSAPTLIPFDLAAWKAGAKAVYRDGTEPVHLFYAPHPKGNRNIITMNKEGVIFLLLEDGTEIVGIDSQHDLMLISPKKRVPLEAIDWIKGGPWWVRKMGETKLFPVVRIEEDGFAYINKCTPTDLQVNFQDERTNDGVTFSPCWKETNL
jgi:hypothetical protein